MRVVSIGECMAELAPAGARHEYRMGFAGDTFNTAWYLAQLSPDTSVSYCSAVGDDAISAQMLEMIRDSGIDPRHVQVRPGRSVGLYLISLSEGERSFSYWRGQSAARLLASDPDALFEAIKTADLVYFSGITLAILEGQGRRTLIEALHVARRAGTLIAFDPNLRPHLWDSPEEMTDSIMRGAAVSDVTLPSFEDEARWFGDAEPGDTLARYARAGAETVIVKNGAEAVLYRSGDTDGAVEVPGVSAIVDTTAAGDSFNAGILAGLTTQTSVPESIALACRLAGHVVQGRGALVPISLDVLDRFQ